MLGNFEISFLGDQELSFEANPVGLSYMSLLKAAKFIKYKRIDICIINRSETLLEVEGIDCSLCQVNINYDVDIYKGKDIETKRKILYEIIFYSMDFLATKKGWNLAFLAEVKLTVINHNYIIFTPYRKPVRNEKRKIIAQLIVFLDIGVGYFKLNIYDYNMELIKSIDFYKVHPHPIIYDWFFTKILWVEENICRVADLDDEILFDINIDDETINTHFVPKGRSLDILHSAILALKYDTPWEDRQKYIRQMIQGS
ncbi:hypothetical protein [Chitinophaga sancti]|uniref:Uncharacterized protein n=1 Tax=Chitinophaga sancti TaxID=1004 RepID=A0A1K1SC58_9BACT|nr:hypothetical protein [Chitinophaga sancti]WQD63597.1 hypothetical protein U0033_04260 [Chitinophaga sancti]WQG90777.1 hypothetical protein SR876_04655 [Chitinophaga sancti]SFW81955.1 hypothetical protein SAMN05661012_05170 [Chitinophaga sancti]